MVVVVGSAEQDAQLGPGHVVPHPRQARPRLGDHAQEHRTHRSPPSPCPAPSPPALAAVPLARPSPPNARSCVAVTTACAGGRTRSARLMITSDGARFDVTVSDLANRIGRDRDGFDRVRVHRDHSDVRRDHVQRDHARDGACGGTARAQKELIEALERDGVPADSVALLGFSQVADRPSRSTLRKPRPRSPILSPDHAANAGRRANGWNLGLYPAS